MKKSFVFAFVTSLMAATLFAADMPLAEARAKIGEAIGDAKVMTETMKQLSAADQKAFLADVNAAIAKMPGSTESKTAAYLNANRAALKGAKKGNLTTLVAEVFATVPPESLTVINEEFAKDLFNRDADPAVRYTDEQFTKIAEKVMESVNERNKTAENGAVRSAFAILMLTRAAVGNEKENSARKEYAANLMQSMIKTLPESIQNTAKVDWLPYALGEKQGENKTYEPMLNSADVSVEMPNVQVSMRLAGPQLLESMLGEVVEGTPLVNTQIFLERNSTTGNPVEDSDSKTPAPVPNPGEPTGYQYQNLPSEK